MIRAKRDRQAHTPPEIHELIAACMRGEVPDYQLSAWLMAGFLNGLDSEETRALTEALVASGTRFDWSDLGRPSADKHSTGGVGDKVSLILAPLIASCGILVPMVAGRGLGHTGGTIDKLEAIPGMQTRLSPEGMRRQLDEVGVVMVGQGPELAPADGLLYSLRDVTSTVESESFIVSSIVSKKVAEGSGTLVYDVKCGNGAFMRTLESARQLATRLVETTRAMGRVSTALITDMNQPNGATVGNALEVREAIDVMRGAGPVDVREVTLELGAAMMVGCGAEREAGAARATLEAALDSGKAFERFVAMVVAQGGDARAVERPDQLPSAPVVTAVPSPRRGRVVGMDTFALGELSVAMGGGRRSKEDRIDPRVGFRMRVRIGDPVEAGAPLADLHLDEPRPEAVARFAAAVRVEDAPADPPALIRERIG